MKYNFLFVLLLTSSFGRGQVISTVAGGGSIFPPDGVAATNCVVSFAGDICIDKFGNLFISSDLNYVYKMTPNNNLFVFAGNGVSGFYGENIPATAAQLHRPVGIVSDSKGNIYISDQNNQRIRKVDTLGIITTYAGTGILGYSGDDSQASNAQLYYPTFLAIDSSDNIYLTEEGEPTIRKINTLGIISTICGTPGVSGYSGDNGPSTSALMNWSYGMHVDYKNNLFFTDGGSAIRKIDLSTGIISKIAGNGTSGYSGDNGPATEASFNGAEDVVVNQNQFVYVSDWHNNRIRQIDTFGIITTIVGDGTGAYNGDNIPASTAEIWLPNGICLDSCANLYISDVGNSRIRKVTFDTNCHFYGALSNKTVNVRSTESVDVFPNPADVALTISTFDKTVTDYFITNSTGKIFWSGITKDTSFRVNIAQWPNGLYFLHARRHDGREMVKKVVKD